MAPVRWLDRYIDHTYRVSVEWTVGSRLDFGPFSRIGSVFNVVFCAAAVIFTLWTGLTGQTAGFVAVAFLAVLEIVFVRVCFRAFRGDFDDFVLDPDDDEEPGLDTPR